MSRKKHALDEFNDDDFDEDGVALGPDKDSPDYRAVKLTIYGGHCAWRDPKKKTKADPYLIVTYQGETRETGQLFGTTHPKWNEVTYDFILFFVEPNTTAHFQKNKIKINLKN